MCPSCLNQARQGDSKEVTDTLNQILKLVKNIDSVTTIKSSENKVKINEIVRVLVKTQSENLNHECESLIKTKSDHFQIKHFSDERTFISSEDRNIVLLNTLLAFCNIDHHELDSVSDSKVKGLCVAYESILNGRNKKVITLPALGKSLRLLKLTTKVC